MPSAACCPCGQLVGCVCSGINCGLVCERRAGIATLCGFNEFLPVAPPRFYKRRRTSGLMTQLLYVDPACGSAVAVPASIECRRKSGTATLVGIREFFAPSTPARVYRRNEASGTLNSYGNGTLVCTVLNRVQTWSGAAQYDKVTGALTDSRCYQNNGGPCNPTGAPNVAHAPSTSGWGAPVNDPNAGCGSPLSTVSQTADQTNSTIQGRGVCVPCFGGNGMNTGAGIANLSDEDLPNDAVDRAKAAIGAWTNDSCPNSSSFQTKRTNNTAISFTFQVGQTRVVITSGLTAGDNYEARIHVERRQVGTSGAFTPTSDLTENFTASGPAFTGNWLDLPNDTEWEYRASGVTVYHEVKDTIEDNWDVDENFSPGLPAICAPTIVADNSDRTVDGSPVAWPFSGSLPGAAYGGLATQETELTERRTIGTDVCTDIGGGQYSKPSGTVTEALSEEDTEQDAIDRAMGAAPWGPCVAGCALPSCSAFQTQRGAGEATFSFAEVRTKATWPATIGVSYLVTIRYASRVLGTGGPFLFYASTTVVVVADAISEETAWIPVPSEPGLEVIAANCSVEVLP